MLHARTTPASRCFLSRTCHRCVTMGYMQKHAQHASGQKSLRVQQCLAQHEYIHLRMLQVCSQSLPAAAQAPPRLQQRPARRHPSE